MNFHQVHNQALEWMSSSTATNNPSTTTKIEVVEDEEEDTKASASSSTTPTPPTTSATSVVIEREHMFDKVVTPSDVGKLNRLVIPKQHAEKYFPLDSSNNEKGLLLNFEDRTGKPWRFRYSYWNSSQSYVMTKGWSRFVKEKKLDAGDIVSFQRGVGDKDKLFIDWRRRPDASTFHLPNHPFQHHHHHHHSQLHYPHPHHNPLQHGRAAAASWTSGAPPAFVLRSHPYAQAQAQAQNPYAPPPQALWDHQAGSTSLVRRGMGMGMGTGHYGYGIGNVVNPAYPVTGSLVFVRSGGGGVGGGGGNSAAATTVLQNVTSTTREGGGGGGGSMIRGESGEEGMVYESVPVVQGKAAAKRLRLFGVNMECPISHQTHDFDILSSSLASSSTSNDDNNHAHPRPHHHYHYNLLHQQQQEEQQQQEQRQQQLQQQQQHEQHHLQQHQQQIPIISMGPPSASSPNQQNSTIHDHHPNLQLRSFFNNGTTSLPPPKGKSSTTSSSMSLDLDI